MTGLISRAERFARVCHEGQFWKGKAQEPYTVHLHDVACPSRALERLRESHSGSLATRHCRGLPTYLCG
jgi:hypothetical protein